MGREDVHGSVDPLLTFPRNPFFVQTRAEQFRSDAKEVLETLSQNVAKMALVRYVVAVWRAARRRYEEYDERFRKWQFLKTQHRWEFEQGSEPEKQLVLEMLRFMAGFILLVGYEVLCPGQSIFWAIVFPSVLCWVVVQKWLPRPLIACYIFMLPLKLPPFLPIRLL